jgi:hypothetical protein
VKPLLSVVDHLVYTTPDVESTSDSIQALFGVRPVRGGQHPAWGTRNALLSLGPLVYLEVIGPDPELPPPDEPRPFELDRLTAPRLATWVARSPDLEDAVRQAKRCGLDLGGVEARSRTRPDGSVLTWTMTDLRMPRAGGVVPYFIDWGATAHPAAGAPSGCSLVSLRAVHPRAGQVRRVLEELGLDLPVENGTEPSLIATITTPRGEIDLR